MTEPKKRTRFYRIGIEIGRGEKWRVTLWLWRWSRTWGKA